MSLYKIHQFSKIPHLVFFILYLFLVGLLVFCWGRSKKIFFILFFRVMVYQFLEIRCLLFQSFEYLLCLHMMASIKIILCAFYYFSKQRSILEIFCDSFFRIIAYSFLLWQFTPLFNGKQYFIYAIEKNRKSIFFEGALLNTLIEMQIGKFVIYEFCKLFLIQIYCLGALGNLGVAKHIKTSSIKATIYIMSLVMAAKNKALYWIIFGIWACYIAYNSITENFIYIESNRFNRNTCYFRIGEILELGYFLNILIVIGFGLYVFFCGKRIDEPIYIARQKSFRMSIE